jgi:Flp pilus assembly protein TadG
MTERRTSFPAGHPTQASPKVRHARSVWSNRLFGGDRGSTTALMAVVLAGGVLLGACAIVVDVGRLYVEREELHSGADAAALAVGGLCATSSTRCGPQSFALAATYANANAGDGVSAVTVVCGRGPGLSGCPAAATNRTACIGPAPAGARYVEVRTATARADGTTLLPPVIAQALAGNAGDRGTRVGACSRVAWGPPPKATGIAIGVAQCNWERMTAGGSTLPTDEQVIYLHDPQTVDPDSAYCPKDPSGKTAPGGFGYLAANADTCMATLTVPVDWAGATGNGMHGCGTPLSSYRLSGALVPLPIYDRVTGTGANTTYHIIGFAAFVVTGWKLSGSAAGLGSAVSSIPASSTSPRRALTYCTGAERCLYGYFTSMKLGTGVPGSGISFGVNVVNVIG